jgi:hypothetical protein
MLSWVRIASGVRAFSKLFVDSTRFSPHVRTLEALRTQVVLSSVRSKAPTNLQPEGK